MYTNSKSQQKLVAGMVNYECLPSKLYLIMENLVKYTQVYLCIEWGNRVDLVLGKPSKQREKLVIVTFLFLCLEWPNSFRNAKKKNTFLRGGGSPLFQSSENMLTILIFSRGENNFDQACEMSLFWDQNPIFDGFPFTALIVLKWTQMWCYWRKMLNNIRKPIHNISVYANP